MTRRSHRDWTGTIDIIKSTGSRISYKPDRPGWHATRSMAVYAAYKPASPQPDAGPAACIPHCSIHSSYFQKKHGCPSSVRYPVPSRQLCGTFCATHDMLVPKRCQPQQHRKARHAADSDMAATHANVQGGILHRWRRPCCLEAHELPDAALYSLGASMTAPPAALLDQWHTHRSKVGASRPLCVSQLKKVRDAGQPLLISNQWRAFLPPSRHQLVVRGDHSTSPDQEVFSPSIAISTQDTLGNESGHRWSVLLSAATNVSLSLPPSGFIAQGMSHGGAR